MPTYIYRARDKQGQLLTATIEAENDLAVALNLRSLGYNTISIEEEGRLKKPFLDFWQRIRKVSGAEIVFFSRQLSTLLHTGISITVALSSIAEQTKSRALREAINGVLKDIQTGILFSEALAKHPAIFSNLFVSMVRVGEVSGMLAKVLDRLAQLGTQELELKARIRTALTYPVILVIVAVGIVSFLLVNVIPKFVSIFETYEAHLPIATQILLGVSLLARRLYPFIIAGIFIFIFWFRKYLRSEKGRYKFDFFLLHLPFFGQLYLKVVVSRFCRTLGELLSTGVPVLEALYVTQSTVRNTVISRVIDGIRSAISEGLSLTEPFKTSGVFPTTVIQMVALGEKSGKLDQMFVEVASFYDREVEYTMRGLTATLEPLLLLLMGGMVAFIALSVLLPIFNLIKVFRR